MMADNERDYLMCVAPKRVLGRCRFEADGAQALYAGFHKNSNEIPLLIFLELSGVSFRFFMARQ
ncbi:hypothetical protein KGP93_31895 [Burkholderia multivorans]|nr:hypothetical protein [Burkholderia multivorans]